jgi:hypothetical protein
MLGETPHSSARWRDAVRILPPLLAALVLLAAVPAAAESPAAAPTGLGPAMAAFDQAYIPALALTNMGKAAPSRKAMLALLVEWARLRDGYADARNGDSWQGAFTEADGLIRQAAGQVDNGALQEAHMTLEQVRDVFLALRTEYGVPYYLDHLTRFHAPMEHIVKLAMKRTPETLTEDDRVQVATWLGEASVLWARTVSTTPNTVWWDMDADRAAQVDALEARVAESLVALKTALDTDDNGAVLAASRAIKPPFARLFMSFGEFPDGAGPDTPST